jgi:hypothetical protein
LIEAVSLALEVPSRRRWTQLAAGAVQMHSVTKLDAVAGIEAMESRRLVVAVA